MQRIVVVGAGTMGAQIAMLAALAGCDTIAADLAEDALAQARALLHARLGRDVATGRRERDDVDAAFTRLAFITDLDSPAATADLVVEAAVEELEVERGDLGHKTGQGFYTYDHTDDHTNDEDGNRG
jgi:3-hydroxybutyryl-CoA dehydrogenase